MTPWRRVLGWSCLGAFLFGFGFVAGIAIERMRFDYQRQAIVGRLEQHAARLHVYLMVLERDGARVATSSPTEVTEHGPQ